MLNFFLSHDSIVWFVGFGCVMAFLNGKSRAVRVKVSILLFTLAAACFGSLIIASQLGY